MSRVWKRFFLKIAKGFAVLLYVSVALVIPELIVNLFDGPSGLGVFIGLIVFLVLPVICAILIDTYKESKREIEWENRKIMMALGSDD